MLTGKNFIKKLKKRNFCNHNKTDSEIANNKTTTRYNSHFRTYNNITLRALALKFKMTYANT